MSNPEKKTLEDLIAGISWILAIVFGGLFAVNYVFDLNEEKTPEFSRNQKFEDAKKNGRTTFYKVLDGPIHSTTYLAYDSFTRKFNCTLSNSGSFDIKRGGDIHIKLGSCSGPFSCCGCDSGIFKYRLDDGPILSASRNEFYDRKKEMVYLPFNWDLFKDSKTVNIRYYSYSDRGKIQKTEKFNTDSVTSTLDAYEYCLDKDYF